MVTLALDRDFWPEQVCRIDHVRGCQCIYPDHCVHFTGQARPRGQRAGIHVAGQAAPWLHTRRMESDYDYDYEYDDDAFPESDEDMASGDDYEFDAHAEVQTAAKRVK